MILMHGDCLERLKELEDNSLDSLVTDPPAGISFMGKAWDDDKGGRDQWIAWLAEVMRECNRVLKPGAHGLVWALPRTSHWTATALEDAGFEIRDVVTHLFGSGFPKSMDISKAVDKAAGVERKEVRSPNPNYRKPQQCPTMGEIKYAENILAPATPEAKEWEGWGTALKPAAEFWWLVRKPLSEKTVAKNVLKWGTGGINIDASRIGFVSTADEKEAKEKNAHSKFESGARGQSNAYGEYDKPRETWAPQGRFPANLVLSHSPSCDDVNGCDMFDCPTVILDRQSGVSKSTGGGMKDFANSELFQGKTAKNKTDSCGFGDFGGASRFFFQARHGNEDICENLAIKNVNVAESNSLSRLSQISDIVLGAAVTPLTGLKKQELLACLDSITSCKDFIQIQKLVLLVASSDSIDTTETIQSLWKLYGYVLLAIEESIKQENLKSGLGPVKATRFIYSTKISSSERGDSKHPTMKTKKLMGYLIKLITPPNGVVLDPFMGSGSTGLAAKENGFKFIGIEKEEEYFQIANARINA